MSPRFLDYRAISVSQANAIRRGNGSAPLLEDPWEGWSVCSGCGVAGLLQLRESAHGAVCPDCGGRHLAVLPDPPEEPKGRDDYTEGAPPFSRCENCGKAAEGESSDDLPLCGDCGRALDEPEADLLLVPDAPAPEEPEAPTMSFDKATWADVAALVDAARSADAMLQTPGAVTDRAAGVSRSKIRSVLLKLAMSLAPFTRGEARDE